jgi:hypothetical protein
MVDTFVISGLARRRATLAGEIAHTQDRLRQMLLDLDTLDAAIRMFDADYCVERIKAKLPRKRKDWTNRGEQTRLIASILRTATKPLSGLEIALEIMTYKQMDTSEPEAVESMRQRVGYTLRKKRRRGEMRSIVGKDQVMRWEIVTDITPQIAANIPSTVC